MVRRWKLKNSRSGPKLPLFDVELKHMENPRNSAEIEAIVLHTRDTVNVVALTKQRDLIVVEQYRFGIDNSLIELPAGIIEGEEPPVESAKRELLEETGYQSEKWIEIGTSYINPAYVDNRCYHFLALDCERTVQPLHQDELEDLEVHLIPFDQISDFVIQGNFRDAISKAALYQIFPPPDHHLAPPAHQI